MIEKINTFTKEIQKFNSLKDEMLEMLEWYKTQKKNENVIDVSDPKINIDIEKIGTEKAITKGIKLYIKVYEEFKNFAGNHKEYKLQDLTAMALIEYMEKYK
jgi:D-lyxose ketol-isomerase